VIIIIYIYIYIYIILEIFSQIYIIIINNKCIIITDYVLSVKFKLNIYKSL